MSEATVRKALESVLAAASGTISTHWENVAFDPVAGVAYQRVSLLRAAPENPTLGGSHRRLRGVFQIALHYPIDKGPKDAESRAVVLQELFRRGLTIVDGGVTVVVPRTPSISPAMFSGDRYVLVVSVPYYADLFT